MNTSMDPLFIWHKLPLGEQDEVIMLGDFSVFFESFSELFCRSSPRVVSYFIPPDFVFYRHCDPALMSFTCVLLAVVSLSVPLFGQLFFIPSCVLLSQCSFPLTQKWILFVVVGSCSIFLKCNW